MANMWTLLGVIDARSIVSLFKVWIVLRFMSQDLLRFNLNNDFTKQTRELLDADSSVFWNMFFVVQNVASNWLPWLLSVQFLT